MKQLFTVIVRSDAGPEAKFLLIDDDVEPYRDPAVIARVIGDTAAQLAKRALRVRTRPEEGGR